MVECWTEDPKVPGSNTNEGVTIINDKNIMENLENVVHKKVTIRSR